MPPGTAARTSSTRIGSSPYVIVSRSTNIGLGRGKEAERARAIVRAPGEVEILVRLEVGGHEIAEPLRVVADENAEHASSEANGMAEHVAVTGPRLGPPTRARLTPTGGIEAQAGDHDEGVATMREDGDPLAWP